jgi:hypothetical protein
MVRNEVIVPLSSRPKAIMATTVTRTSSSSTSSVFLWWWIVVAVSGGSMMSIGVANIHAWQSSHDLASRASKRKSKTSLSEIYQRAQKNFSSAAAPSTILNTATQITTRCEEHHPQLSSSCRSVESSTRDNNPCSTRINLTNNYTKDGKTRTFQTPVDILFRSSVGTQLPRPSVMHVVLSSECCDCHGIFVIGDVHGCYDEMIELVDVATQRHNDGREFCHVILVGDLCNKGPKSVAVLRHVQHHSPRWRAVRGNHDDATLKAALNMGWETHDDDHPKNNNRNPANPLPTKYQWIQTEGQS